MSSSCYHCVRLCANLHEWPAAVLCTLLAMIQMAVLDYYLVHYLGIFHLTWLAFDAINLTMLIISIRQARRAIQQYRMYPTSRGQASGSMGWLAWLFMSISVAAKAVVTFRWFSHHLAEATSTFFGPNTLKTTIALGSCTFLLLLITQHDVPAGSDGRRHIEEMAGTVVFDILDTVDILQVLFDLEIRYILWTGLEEFILTIAVMNLVLPTLPLYMLAKSKFGQKKLSVKFIHGHRILLVLSVNLPNLVIRLMLWHGISTGVSPFTLKNVLAISITLYDIYEHNKEIAAKEEAKKARKTAAGLRFEEVQVRISDSDGMSSQSAVDDSRTESSTSGVKACYCVPIGKDKKSDKSDAVDDRKRKRLKSQPHAVPAQTVGNGRKSNSPDASDVESEHESPMIALRAVRSSVIV